MPSSTPRPPLETECPEENIGNATVKVLLALDASGSLQFTDPDGNRRRAVRDFLSVLATQNEVYVNTSVFGSVVRTSPLVRTGDDVFMPSGEWVEPDFLGRADVITDYQSALETIHGMLQLDMEQTSAEELARTRYVVLWFSDGSPTPVCCTDGDETSVDDAALPFSCGAPSSLSTSEAICDGVAELTLCNDASFLFEHRDAADTSESPQLDSVSAVPLASLDTRGDFNRAHQLEAATAAIVDLKDSHDVLDVAVHTRLLFDPNLDAEVQDIYQLNHCVASSTLMNMASTGRGTYAEFDVASSISFLDINTSGRMCFR